MIVSKSYQWSEAGARIVGAMGLMGLLGSVTPAAAQDMGDTLQVHGFLSQALIITDDNNLFGPSSESGGSTEFTEVGVNFSVRPHEDVLVAAQMLSRRAGGDGSEAQPELDYGVIDYQMISNQERTVGVQVGRIKNPFGFYNQTRDVAFTRPSILLPQSIYFDRTRSLGLAGDGAGIYFDERLSNGRLRTEISAGNALVGNDVERTLGLSSFPGSFNSRSSIIGQIRYEYDGGRIISALSAGQAKADYDSPKNGVGDGNLIFEPWVFSLQYNAEKWSLTGEYALRKVSLNDFQAFRNFKTIGESWFLQYTYRFYEDWEWLIRYDSLVNDRNDPSGRKFEDSGLGPAYSQFARDTTIGLQWRIHPQVLVSAEYHYVDGTGWLPVQDNPDLADTDRYWNMFLTQLSLRF